MSPSDIGPREMREAPRTIAKYVACRDQSLGARRSRCGAGDSADNEFGRSYFQGNQPLVCITMITRAAQSFWPCMSK